MEVTLKRGDITTGRAGAVVLGILEGGAPLDGAAAAFDRRLSGAIARLRRRGDVTGRFLETVVLYPAWPRAPRLVLVGLGRRAELDAARVRLAAAAAARRARDIGAGSLATVAHGAGRGGLNAEVAAAATVEGAMLGAYRFTAYRSDAGARPLERVELVERDAAAAEAMAPAVARAAGAARATCLARDLANTPGQDLTPDGLAARAREIAGLAGATIEVLGIPQMERLGMGALLAVGRGSPHEPCFIVLEYSGTGSRAGGARSRTVEVAVRPGARVPRRDPRGDTRRDARLRVSPARAPRETPRDTVVLIGKGVTFDTGGISLKPRENMHRMKGDMSGAAAVLGVFSALPALALPFRVVGLIPSAENMPGSRALKPGDIVRALDGTTIEVTNTDAEGRLLLADALGYARRLAPAAVVDIATLTGSITLALGHAAAGLFTGDDRLADALIAAGEASGERLWRMPLWDAYAPEMRGDTADLVNSAAREGGACLAAIFLRHFAGDMPWAHLDIAGMAWAGSERPHEARGATGFGARLLLEWLSRRASAAATPTWGAAPASSAV
ncbi:MAG: leucyl aminopeptidase [Candidatus Eisenbacteria bacterium]|uniref:Probable cytosol aminopeptidase n=1 Tax=Eiseniibacteriota bacterium TaxID=2212470 RepID=A0A9D6QLI4_UNCEI|nr:leucyl aminopeptidase [Candidatus Eisenbacteria bacterium]MBI3538733.1 leucyl aminopeptidase [Candidatus Eisenbacteria bacterium]